MENRQLNFYNSEFSLQNKILRVIWNSVYYLLFRPFPTPVFRTWRIFVLKCFGAQIHFSSHVYASVKIWAPWNLSLGEYSCLGPYVDCYNQGKIHIGNHTIISQKSNLCASTHDYKKKNFPLLLKPITIQDGVWIASNAFIGPGVTIESNCVVAACAVVVSNVKAYTIVGGNPAKKIRNGDSEKD